METSRVNSPLAAYKRLLVSLTDRFTLPSHETNSKLYSLGGLQVVNSNDEIMDFYLKINFHLILRLYKHNQRVLIVDLKRFNCDIYVK